MQFLSRYWHFFLFPCFLLFTFLLYFQSISFGITYSDDNVIFLNHGAFLSDIDNIPKTFLDDDFQTPGPGTYYRPLVMSSLILDTQWKSPNSYAAYHLTSIVLFAITTWLCFLFFRALGFPTLLCFFAALLFLVHPGNNQSVAWMTGRVDILLTIFVLSTLLFFLHFFRTQKAIWGILSFLFFVLALFTKETAIVLPIVFVGMGMLLNTETPSQKGIFSWFRKEKKRDVLPVLFFGVMVAVGTVAWFFLRKYALASDIPGAEENGIFTRENVLFILHNLPFVLPHLGKIMLPVVLSPYHIAQDMRFSPGIFSLLFLGIGAWFLRKRIRYSMVLFGLSWFLIFLLPTFLNPDPEQEKAFFENRLTLPIIGILLILLEYSRAFWNQRKQFLIILWSIVLFVFAFLSFRNIGYYQDGATYWKRAVETSPHSSFAWNNLGAMEYLRGEKEIAKSHWKRSLHENENEKLANANLGLLAMESEEYETAEQYFLRELEVDPFSEKGVLNLAILYANTGRLSEAKALLNSFLKVFSHHTKAQEMLFQIETFEAQQKKE